VGFIIAVILSWIYDIHPEGGIVKTEPAHKVKIEETLKSSNSWKIASYISFVVIVGLIVLNVIARTKRAKDVESLDKSIAVLPFRNDSPDQERMYFINGTMEAILDNLCKIEDLRVPGRTSVEQYRDNPKPILTVAEEMDVSYILEGSGHRDGNNVRLIIQLLDGRKDRHLWSKTYDANIEEIFSMQSEIAQLVAAEIEAIITPGEKELIERIPTANLTAYDYYQRGKEEYWKFRTDRDNKEALERAEDLYYIALDYDSTFALAHTGLARVYWDKYRGTYFSETFLDSALILAEKAISLDNQIAEVYAVRGDCYREIGQTKQAIWEYDKALELNPNSWMAYNGKGELYRKLDFLRALENLHKAVSLNRGSELPILLRDLWIGYYYAGFQDKAFYYLKEKFKLDRDSIEYYLYLSWFAYDRDDFPKGIEYGKKALAMDSSNREVKRILGLNYSSNGQHEQSLKYLKIVIEGRDTLDDPDLGYMHRLGYEYWQNGFKKEANYYFDKQIEYCNRANELGRKYSKEFASYYDLAGTYAFRGEKDKAYENLRIYNQIPVPHYRLILRIERDPLFDSIRGEPEFQQLARDVEAKYQAEHERVRKWLEENDML
jgi:TolB-like protein/lipopolysaccharide biosynthesis regulator YciM